MAFASRERERGRERGEDEFLKKQDFSGPFWFFFQKI